jgi:hypothetical protein
VKNESISLKKQKIQNDFESQGFLRISQCNLNPATSRLGEPGSVIGDYESSNINFYSAYRHTEENIDALGSQTPNKHIDLINS